MSSRGEMKMSLSEMTFSCLRCLSSFNSRYVRLARTGVLKGFMIFLTATFWLVSWSLAELQSDARSADALYCYATLAERCAREFSAQPVSRPSSHLPNQSKCAHADGLQVRISRGRVNTARSWWVTSAMSATGTTNLEVISNVVPKIWARMNSAIVKKGHSSRGGDSGRVVVVERTMTRRKRRLRSHGGWQQGWGWTRARAAPSAGWDKAG